MSSESERESTLDSEISEKKAKVRLSETKDSRRREGVLVNNQQNDTSIEERTAEARREFDAAIEKIKPRGRRKNNINELVVGKSLLLYHLLLGL